MANTLTITVEDIEDLPEFNASGWNDHTDARMFHGKCFAYALDNTEMAVIPGKGNERIRENTSMIEHLMGEGITLHEPPELPYEENLKGYAVKQWQNMVERDGMLPVAPDKNGVLNVPKGSTLVFLTATQTYDAFSRSMKLSRHWYRADRPQEGTDQVTWSHWEGGSHPISNHGSGKLTDPWNQCAGPKSHPVGYFLVASKKALEGRDSAQSAVAHNASKSHTFSGIHA